MLADAERVCSYCRAVRIDGVWGEMCPVEVRAEQLSQVSDAHDAGHYHSILTQGGRPE